jgi:hypothetical protein
MVAAPLAELTARAQTLTSAGDLVGARRVLANVLDPADADPRHADADLALAAALHARILIALGDPHGARVWAGFAHAAEERLHGPRHERTLAAAATHAAVLQRVGHYGKAAQVYQRLVGSLAELDGTDSARALAAEADLATAEHAAGHCTSARARLTDAWVRHRHHHGDAAPAGIKMLARLGAMERECARDAEAREHLALAQELCARYLPADHPLVRQVAALALGTSSGRHVCGRVEQSHGPQQQPGEVAAAPHPAAGPAHPAAVTHSAAGPPHQAAVAHPAAGPPHQAAVAHPASAVPHPRRPPVQAAEDAGFPPDVHDPDRQPAGAVGLPLDGRPAAPVQPLYRSEGDRSHPAQGPQGHQVVRNPPYAADGSPAHPTVARPAHGAENGYENRYGSGYGTENGTYRARSGSSPVYAPGDLTGRHARSDAPPPLPGGRASHFRSLTTGDRPDTDNLLPVRLEAPEPAGPRRQPFLLVAVLIAGIAVAAAVVALALTRDNGTAVTPAPQAAATSTAPTATAEPSAAATPATPADPGAPTDVTLRDNRDSVALKWTYPDGAEGPLLVSGGREGQQLKVFQQLAAGTADYMVYGLNEGVNYCFTVAVAYSTDRIAASAPVCTRR